jgi:predicted GNAT family N-acyltransferase
LHPLTKDDLSPSERQKLIEFLVYCYNEPLETFNLTHPELNHIILAKTGDRIIGTACSYVRNMSINSVHFIAAQVGSVAVHPDFRGNHLVTRMIRLLHDFFKKEGVDASFLFTYEPKYYISSGYKMLNNQMRFFDKKSNSWNQFVWGNSMYQEFGNFKLSSGLIDFNGIVF